MTDSFLVGAEDEKCKGQANPAILGQDSFMDQHQYEVLYRGSLNSQLSLFTRVRSRFSLIRNRYLEEEQPETQAEVGVQMTVSPGNTGLASITNEGGLNCLLASSAVLPSTLLYGNVSKMNSKDSWYCDFGGVSTYYDLLFQVFGL